jgi:hypothetical protein
LNKYSWISSVDDLEICSRSPSSVTSLIGAIKNFAYACFCHYWPSSEGIANAVKELLSMPRLLITLVKPVILDGFLLLTYIIRGVMVQDIS